MHAVHRAVTLATKNRGAVKVAIAALGHPAERPAPVVDAGESVQRREASVVGFSLNTVP